LVNLETIAFWKKKEASKPPERIIPLPNLSAPTLEPPAVTPVDDVNRAREELKVLKLERQILGSAVTTIYEFQSKGVISEAERDRMLEKYKVDLKRLEKGIEQNQQVVDLHDLEVERKELLKSFQTKLEEIDSKLRHLKTGAPVQATEKSESGASKNKEDTPISPPQESKSNSNPQSIADSEKRIDQIREEILKAMDRLEQIETEE